MGLKHQIKSQSVEKTGDKNLMENCVELRFLIRTS